ncbi:unnamed protein product [Ceratitis capitata]|uniref:(Mediterranean fruit fly) hypothetical protein n=1 Tax=Ceratitis capitata TaxID=7213 RepID=A0A811V243_CERCA|nr:unnamed protein product [Ceratitis capitata]
MYVAYEMPPTFECHMVGGACQCRTPEGPQACSVSSLNMSMNRGVSDYEHVYV